MAPEFFKDQPHGMPVDIWALGVLLFEMAHAYAPFDIGGSEGEKISLILDSENCEFAFKETLSEEYRDLVE